ncbi:XPG I-region protein [Mycena albidolilacea]|uniref:XPG I-region protein n=1 Tax=Mycena albidolilacea TaxID=1033008 RepID=A0AAD7EKT2_9AGAR|nr:XPG I-region protein [Mycena albidolilacea]
MTIKHLENFLLERKHQQTLPLSALSDSRLGIDASYYLSQLTDAPPAREPLLAATGGLPLALTQRIEADLRALEKLRIKPVFVFPGLSPNRRFKGPNAGPNAGAGAFAAAAETEASRDRRDAWAKYEAGQEDAATRLFEGRSAFAQWDLWRMVLRIFRHRNVEFIVAPYVAWAQLIYLQRHPKQYIHAIYGPPDTLLYPGVDKLVVSFDLSPSSSSSPSTVLPSSSNANSNAAPSFTFLSKRGILGELGLSEDQFLDVAILVGGVGGEKGAQGQTGAFPPTMHEQALKATVDMVKYYKSGFAAVSAFAEHPAVKGVGYTEYYARTRSLIRYSLILSAEGVVLPLPVSGGGGPGVGAQGGLPGADRGGPSGPTAADVPTDLHEVFTNRLPDEVFFYLSRGLLAPQALVWLTSGQIVEGPPLDNGETTEYKRFVKEVVTDGQTGPRATALALISSVSHPFWAARKVAGVFWFEGGQQAGQQGPGQGGQKAVQHNAPQTVQLAERVAGWHVPYAVVEDELRRQNSATIDFALCLGATSSERLAARTKGKAGGAAPLEKKDEVVANVIWRFLELRGFLLNTHTHSPLARAMYAAIKSAKLNDKFQDPLYLFLELVRAGVMHGHLWSGRAFSGGPSFGTDEEKACMLLVMRVLSIVPLNFKPVPWSAPLSRELLVFNSFVRSLTRALRTLLEVTSLNMLLRNDARRARDDLLDIALSLPFQTEVNTGFGVLGKVYLDALTHINNRTRVRDPNAPGVKEAKAMALEICEETFPGVKYPKLEVERGFRFWDVALTAMRQLHSEGAVLRELIDQFEAAEAWLAPMRP